MTFRITHSKLPNYLIFRNGRISKKARRKLKDEEKEKRLNNKLEKKEKKEKKKKETEKNKAVGILNIFKDKLDESKRMQSFTDDLDFSEFEKTKKTPREEAKEKAENEEKVQTEEKPVSVLAKAKRKTSKNSSTRTKAFQSPLLLDKFEAIEEANSNEEISTVKQSISSRMVDIAGKNESGSNTIPEEEGKQKSYTVGSSTSDAVKHVKKSSARQLPKIKEDVEVSNIEASKKDKDSSDEGEESEIEEQSKSQTTEVDFDYEKPVFPRRKKKQYFEKIKANRKYDNKILLVNYQYKGDYEFFLKKLYYLYSLRPKLVIISYPDDEGIKPYFLNRLAEHNDVKVVMVKQSDKEILLNRMTIMTGKKLNRKMVLGGINVSCEILHNHVIYSWGCAYNGKLGIGEMQHLENNSDFQVACPVSFNREYHDMANSGGLNYHKHIYTHVPQIVLENYGQQFKSISCGRDHSVALTQKEGLVYVWGDNTYAQLGVNLKNNSLNINSSQEATENNSPSKSKDGISLTVPSSFTPKNLHQSSTKYQNSLKLPLKVSESAYHDN